MSEMLTEKTIGCFEYSLKDHVPVVGEFKTYEAFYDYSMAVRRLGKYESTKLTPEQVATLKEYHDFNTAEDVEASRYVINLIEADRERAKGCEYCGGTYYYNDNWSVRPEIFKPKFCPMCGRKLEAEK